mmetsp:Transcript_25001/g.75415  ORF Transcript_25001/g.75415 Transcript_25001/m.75415 type:complete len:254 (+) Transcript_25001:60-821(+)
MVLVEELAEEEEAPTAQEPEDEASKGRTALNKGFLQQAKEPLYGPEGSPEGHVAPETHKAHAEHKLNEDMNAGMNRGAKDNNSFERPPWYTKEWPKDCQYNSPGCDLTELSTSGHTSELHRGMVQDNNRWREALAAGVKSMHLSFLSLTDEDLAEVIACLKGNEDITELDLTHNKIKDAGVQALVAALAAGAAPNLRELRLYSNEFGELGKTMLTQGLPVFRKKLEVKWEEPSWAKEARAKATKAAAMAPAAA